MITRLPSNLLLLVLSGVLAVFCFALRPGTAAWIGLGVGCAAAVLSLAGFAWSRRGGGQRALDVCALLVAIWLIISARVFAPSTAKWLCFADAAALAVLAVIGLLLAQMAFQREIDALRATPLAASGNGHAPGAHQLRHVETGR